MRPASDRESLLIRCNASPLVFRVGGQYQGSGGRNVETEVSLWAAADREWRAVNERPRDNE